MSGFVEPSDKQRLAASRGLTDAALVGHYWRLEDLDGLTDGERHRLKSYRHDTFGFEEYCEALVARGDRESDDGDLVAVLDRWEAAFLALRCWHHERSVLDGERNPVAKVLIYEESRITGVRGRLCPRLAVVDQHTGAPISRPHPRSPAGRERPRLVKSVRSASVETPDERGPDSGALTDAILALAEAVDRLAEVIPRRPGSRTPPQPRSGRSAEINAGAPKGG